jgi:hypothetical protein
MKAFSGHKEADDKKTSGYITKRKPFKYGVFLMWPEVLNKVVEKTGKECYV